MAHSDLIERLLLNPEVLQKLTPTETLAWGLVSRVREATDEQIVGGATVLDAQAVSQIRALLLYAVDDLDSAHRIFQDDHSNLGSYGHGMMHRREGDFDNARYWFRRAGRLGFFSRLQDLAAEESRTMAKQSTWDAYLVTGLCEQAKYGDTDLVQECVALQRAEFRGVLEWCWGKAVGAGAA